MTRQSLMPYPKGQLDPNNRDNVIGLQQAAAGVIAKMKNIPDDPSLHCKVQYFALLVGAVERSCQSFFGDLLAFWMNQCDLQTSC